jgi:hypothetical protein
MAEIAVSDGSNFSVINNISRSVMVGVEAAGLNNYASFSDADGDGFAGNVDPNDANAAVYPFSAGNAGLATAVTATNPVNLATGVATTGSTFSVTFNKVIDQRTLPASFTLNNGITGAVTYDPATRTATFAPSVSLLSGTAYTATLSQALLDQGGIALSAPYSWSFTASGSLPSLSATIAGGGNVNSDTGNPGIHGILPGTYSSPYAWNAPVALTSAPYTGWDFVGWGGDGTCVGTISPCNLIMDLQTRSVTATFTVQPNIRSTINTGNLYGTIQSAFDTAVTGDDLLVQALTFTELPEPVFNRPGVAIRMIGGYNAGFGANPGTTYLRGSLRIKGGTLRVEKIVVTP